jgi:5'-nucleotidase
MPVILVTNDDGVNSPGIHMLADALRPLGDVTVVAPTQEASAIGHALTLRRPLRIEPYGPGLFGVDGTPTDCVNLGVDIVLKQKPDLVVSGINKGWNIGDDVTYSGTVAGAMEAALLGIPGIAVSLKRTPEFDFTYAAEAAVTVARGVLSRPWRPRTFLNVNVNTGRPKGLRVTRQARRNHVTKIASRTDPRGQPYYWIEEALDDWHPDDGKSDYEAVMEGYVSVTPLQADLTDFDALEALAKLLD